MAANADALRAGTLDAVQLFQPYAEDLLASGAGHLWYAAADRGRTAYTTFVTRRSKLQEKRDEFVKMVRAMRRTLQWVSETSGAEIESLLRPYFHDVPPAIFAAAVDRYRAVHLYASDPVVQREGFDRLATAMRSGGALRREIPFEACIDNSLAEEVLATP
jgi:NitT/TauT family transport system substrate-binding protein